MGGSEETSKGQYKHEEGEAGGRLEPDPRYGRCCSSVCRPGYALRDALLGLLVLLGLAVVVAVIFVVCFYVIPDEKQLIEEGLLSGSAEEVIGGLVEVNEITLQDGDKYKILPNDSGKSTAGRSQDFNTFSTAASFEAPTTKISSADSSQFKVFQDAADVVSPTRDSEARLEGRDNVHSGPRVPESHHHEHNLGHHDERPRIEGGMPHGEGTEHEEEIDFFANLDPEPVCGTVQLPMCTSSVPWNLAGLPNWLGHRAVEEVFASLDIVKSLLVESECSALAPLYACSILEPPCRDAKVLPPCRSFCLDVARSCEVPDSSGVAAMFDCGKFPDSSDPSVCVSAQQEPLHLTNSAIDTQHDTLPNEHFQNSANVPNLHNTNSMQHLPDQSKSDLDHDTHFVPSTQSSTDDDKSESGPAEDGLAICTMEMFMCLDGSDCLLNSYVCDGNQNCADNSDENNCTVSRPECSGADDFQCASTGLCVPSSWLCDGADDCRDNSDEQNCPQHREGFVPLTNDDNKGNPVNGVDATLQSTNGQGEGGNENPPSQKESGTGEPYMSGGVKSKFSAPVSRYHPKVPEFDRKDSAEIDVEQQSGAPEPDAPPFAYDEYDSNNPAVINEPALVGPSLNDPGLLESVYGPNLEFNRDEEAVLRDEPENFESEAKTSDNQVAPSEESADDVPHPVLQSRPFNGNFEPSDDSEAGSESAVIGKEDINLHPIPDVDYPAKETFSVDSSSSVDQRVVRFKNEKVDYHDSLGSENQDLNNPEAPEKLLKSTSESDSSPSTSRTPSQRIRERLAGANRRRFPPSAVPDQQVKTEGSSDDIADSETSITARPTRPPSRLEGFQERFREWRQQRRPTLPADMQPLQATRLPEVNRVTPVERRYELIRRRPQRVNNVKETREEISEAEIPVSKSSSEVLGGEEPADNFENPSIGQPVTLPKNVLPETNPNIYNEEHEENIADNKPIQDYHQAAPHRRRIQNRNRIPNRRIQQQDQMPYDATQTVAEETYPAMLHRSDGTDEPEHEEARRPSVIHQEPIEVYDEEENSFNENEAGDTNVPNVRDYDSRRDNEEYDSESARERYEPPTYTPRQYQGQSVNQYRQESDTESQFNPPNNFRVSFPLPRNTGSSRPALYRHRSQQPPLPNDAGPARSENSFQFNGHEREQQQHHQAEHPQEPHQNNFQYREDALTSELHYDVPAVNQRPFRIYHPSGEGRHDPYSSARERPL
ncbi:uncharacterized protein LOC108671598 isoform X2 [Hyalella azteca]|uniref:Uncharacterized protein LOC108671598 isoform X2 n=1 Tax=Hyalella azteca TaxID=294128 RepID=A0A8B7NLW8_HYAAZ|nr:uncharacterized protein LOC108671598 isoform X2 [Hyalella azteca]